MRNTTYLTDKQVADRFSISRATTWRWVEHHKFPKPIKLSPGCTRWRLSDIEQWEAGQESPSLLDIKRTEA